jgi:anti-sigma regulatory factor (Ser/Thr protein kinase)
VPNRLSEVARASRWAVRLATEQGFSDSDAARVDLVLSEALTNIISHGYARDIGDWIELVMQVTEPGISILVRDRGRPFDPLQAPPLLAARSLAEAQVGGLGIPLMRRYADEIRYARQAGRNDLTLMFRPRVPSGPTAP